MGIEITPDYDKKQKCYYCGKRYASKKYSYRESWYGITQKHTLALKMEISVMDFVQSKMWVCQSSKKL